MNRPEPDFGEFEFEREEYLSNDEVPETLIEVLKHLAMDFVPEMAAACHEINKWQQKNPSVESGEEAQRFLAMCHFEVDGVQISSVAEPFRFYLLECLQRTYEEADESEQGTILNAFKPCNMYSLLDMTLTRVF